MTFSILAFIAKLINNPKKLFLLDGYGACLTATILLGILASYEEYFGMPKKIVYYLAFAAILFSIYSFYCYFFISKNWKTYLKIITVTNTLYCVITLGLVVYFYQQLTFLGILYFLLEVMVITFLVYIERLAILKIENNNLKK